MLTVALFVKTAKSTLSSDLKTLELLSARDVTALTLLHSEVKSASSTVSTHFQTLRDQFLQQLQQREQQLLAEIQQATSRQSSALHTQLKNRILLQSTVTATVADATRVLSNKSGGAVELLAATRSVLQQAATSHQHSQEYAQRDNTEYDVKIGVKLDQPSALLTALQQCSSILAPRAPEQRQQPQQQQPVLRAEVCLCPMPMLPGLVLNLMALVQVQDSKQQPPAAAAAVFAGVQFVRMLVSNSVLISFNFPAGIAVDAQRGVVVVVDYKQHCVKLYDLDGKFIRTIGSKGIDDYQFSSPYRCVMMGDGRIAIGDSENYRVAVYTVEGKRCFSFGELDRDDGEFNSVSGIAVTTDGQFVVADQQLNRVQVFSSSLSFLRKFGQKGKNPGQLSSPSGVAVHDSVVYVVDSDNHRISCFDFASGRFLRCFSGEGSGEGQLQAPTGCAIDSSSGLLFVCDTGNCRIVVFRAADGQFVGQWDCKDQCPHAISGVAVSGRRVYVTDGNKHRSVQIYELKV